jgi:hypothetical protein
VLTQQIEPHCACWLRARFVLKGLLLIPG